MLFAVIGSSAGKTRNEIMAIYPRHKAFVDQFIARGEVVGVGGSKREKLSDFGAKSDHWYRCPWENRFLSGILGLSIVNEASSLSLIIVTNHQLRLEGCQ